MTGYQFKWWQPLLAGLLLFSLAGLAQAAEFSAVIVTKAQGQERPGKIYVKGEKVRREFAGPTGNIVTIIRGDKKVVWMLMAGQQAYMEIPFDQETMGRDLMPPKEEAGMTKLGTETVNGYATDKYETWVKQNGGQLRGHMWVAQKLGMPIKIVSQDQSFSQEYRDIKEGGVDDAVFEIPPGYQKMSRPPGMPPMKGTMPGDK